MLNRAAGSIARSRPTTSLSSVASRVNRAMPAMIQKRTLYTAPKLKGLYDPLTQEAKSVSPLFGAAEYESKALQRRYGTESSAPAIELVQELFYQQGPQFKPTANKSKAAYALTPGILGLVIGALESGKLQDPEVRKYIIDQWRNEYARITQDKRSFSATKIDTLLSLIESEYARDQYSVRSILLGFLYAKAIPDNDHDMIHYFAGVNRYIPVFADQSSPMAEKVKVYVTQKDMPKKESVLPEREVTFFDKIASALQAMKEYFVGSSDKKPTYEPETLAFIRSELRKKPAKEAIREALGEKFELTLSAIIDEKRVSSLYPPKIIQSSYGYRGQVERPNCVETAIQDLLDIMLYDPKLKSFDLSLLPSELKLNDDFKKFYSDYSGIDMINSKQCGQAFMNLVSDVPGVNYVKGNYELSAQYSENNFLVLLNHFFGINAQNLNELGQKLSDDRREITFMFNPASTQTTKKMSMNIKNKQTNQALYADFCFTAGHGWLEASERDKQGLKKLEKKILDPQELAQNYRVTPTARALFSLQPDTNELLRISSEIPPSSYYAFEVESENQKISVIRKIVQDMDVWNQTPAYYKSLAEPFDYACTLYSQLGVDSQRQVLYPIIRAGIRSGRWDSNTHIKNIFINNTFDVLKVAVELCSGHVMSYAKFMDFIKELYQLLPDDKKRGFISEILLCTAETSIISTNFIMALYELVAADSHKRTFLADMLSISVLFKLNPSIDYLAIAKKCIEHGADLDASPWSGTCVTPLIAAILVRDIRLIDLLVSHGASVNTLIDDEENKSFLKKLGGNRRIYNARKITPLGVAITKLWNFDVVKYLLEHGADPNVSNMAQDSWRRWMNGSPIFFAINESDIDAVNLLIQWGANVNSYLTYNSGRKDTALDFAEDRKKSSNGTKIDQIIKILKDAGAKKYDDLNASIDVSKE